MSRRRWRTVIHAGLIVVAVGFVIRGHRGWVVDDLPAHFIGYLFAGFWVAGLLGVNVWAGGPLDPRNDPKPAEPRRWRPPDQK